MRFYELRENDGPVDGTFVGTFAEARAWARTKKASHPSWDLCNLRVVEVDVRTDKEGVLACLAWRPIKTPLRQWKVTQRGGLKEVQ